MKKLATIMVVTITLFGGSHASAQENNKVKKLSGNVYSIFLAFYQSLVVIGNDGVLIVDPANSARAAALKAEIAKLTSLPVTKIVLTHEHYDHVGGTGVFPKAEIYAHKHTEALFRLDVTGQAPAKVDHYVGDKTTLAVGETQVDLLHLGAADGVGMLAVHLPKEKVVYSADLYEANEITKGMWLADSNYLGSRRLLNALVAFEPRYAITAHSADIDTRHLRIAADFYNDLFAAVEPTMQKALGEGFGAVMGAIKTLPKEVSLPRYKGLGNYDHLPAHVERMVFSIFHGG